MLQQIQKQQESQVKNENNMETLKKYNGALVESINSLDKNEKILFSIVYIEGSVMKCMIF